MTRKQKQELIRWFKAQAGVHATIAKRLFAYPSTEAYHKGARDAYQKAANVVRDADAT